MIRTTGAAVVETSMAADLLAGPDRHSAVFLALPDAVLICDPSGRIVEANPAAQQLFGYPAEQLVGSLPGESGDPDAAALQADAVRWHLSAHPEWSGDVPIRRPDGSRVVARTTWTALYEAARPQDPIGYLGVLRDVTGETLSPVMAAEAQARQANQRLTAIIASANDAFVSIDLSGLVTEWNTAATSMFGWSRPEALGRPLTELIIPAGMRAAHEAGLARLGSGGQPVVLNQRLELTALRRDGAEFPIELNLWRAQDTAEEFHAFLRDISDRVRAQTRATAFTARQQAIVEAQLEIAQVELTPSKVMQRICEQAAGVTRGTAAVIELRDGDELVYRSVSAALRDHLGLRLPVDASFSGLCLTTGRTLICHDTESDPRVNAEACRRIGVRSMIVAPLRHGNAVVGVLKVMAEEPDRFDDDDAGALELLAVPFATAMTNAWRLEATSQRAMSDPMTGLANRAYALHELERSLARQHRHGGHTAVIFVDLDRFKVVNDTWGHAAGDELLSAVADRLRAAVRTTDTAARYGGDEFVIICERMSMPGDATILAQRLVSAIGGEYQLEAGTASIGASVGIGVAAGAVAAATLLRTADEAMYEAKQAGGSRYRIRALT